MLRPSQLEPWETLAVDPVLELPPWFSVLRDRVKLPSGRVIPDYYRIESPDYALICARDEEDRVLLERHYKQCLGRFILTLPAGTVDPGEIPMEAARRELLEETGYRAGGWSEGGSFTVDGTRGICRAHFFFAGGLTPVATPKHNDMEEFEIIFHDRVALSKDIREGSICLLPDIALLGMAFSTLFDPRPPAAGNGQSKG